ncbi:hypothetical protein Y032_0252g221 [Ancylostoma ceylanicum]|uniref:Uncharacterized protein n=1 Tax=Ancylostoma ceylanicum TaxID=53326 RepID=A0A016SBV9_9BILA|nr:hypothetical protein Y032_0252g221 [Ancylostoma ceylanicum]
MNFADLVCDGTATFFLLKKEALAKSALNSTSPANGQKNRPEQRWLDRLHADLKLAGIHPDQAYDGDKWRRAATKADPATKRDKRWRIRFSSECSNIGGVDTDGELGNAVEIQEQHHGTSFIGNEIFCVTETFCLAIYLTNIPGWQHS